MAEPDHRYRAIIPPHSGELNCTICLGLLYEPTACPCEHIFCKNCIEQWLVDHSSCPQCRQGASTTSLVKASASMMDQILNLEVKCINGDLGCDEAGTLEHLKLHTDICPYQMIKCQNGACQYRMLLKDKDAHDSECPYFFTSCTVCKIGVMRARLPEHLCDGEIQQLMEFKISSLMKLYEENTQNQELSPEVHSKLLKTRQESLQLLEEARQKLHRAAEVEAEINKGVYKLCCTFGEMMQL